jgi:hypothetical protein
MASIGPLGASQNEQPLQSSRPKNKRNRIKSAEDAVAATGLLKTTENKPPKIKQLVTRDPKTSTSQKTTQVANRSTQSKKIALSAFEILSDEYKVGGTQPALHKVLKKMNTDASWLLYHLESNWVDTPKKELEMVWDKIENFLDKHNISRIPNGISNLLGIIAKKISESTTKAHAVFSNPYSKESRNIASFELNFQEDRLDGILELSSQILEAHIDNFDINRNLESLKFLLYDFLQKNSASPRASDIQSILSQLETHVDPRDISIINRQKKIYDDLSSDGISKKQIIRYAKTMCNDLEASKSITVLSKLLEKLDPLENNPQINTFKRKLSKQIGELTKYFDKEISTYGTSRTLPAEISYSSASSTRIDTSSAPETGKANKTRRRKAKTSKSLESATIQSADNSPPIQVEVRSGTTNQFKLNVPSFRLGGDIGNYASHSCAYITAVNLSKYLDEGKIENLDDSIKEGYLIHYGVTDPNYNKDLPPFAFSDAALKSFESVLQELKPPMENEAQLALSSFAVKENQETTQFTDFLTNAINTFKDYPSFGIMATSHGYTYGIYVKNNEDGTQTITINDSHGIRNRGDAFENAYEVTFDNIEQAALFLAIRSPHQNGENDYKNTISFTYVVKKPSAEIDLSSERTDRLKSSSQAAVGTSSPTLSTAAAEPIFSAKDQIRNSLTDLQAKGLAHEFGDMTIDAYSLDLIKKILNFSDEAQIALLREHPAVIQGLLVEGGKLFLRSIPIGETVSFEQREFARKYHNFVGKINTSEITEYFLGTLDTHINSLTQNQKQSDYECNSNWACSMLEEASNALSTTASILIVGQVQKNLNKLPKLVMDAPKIRKTELEDFKNFVTTPDNYDRTCLSYKTSYWMAKLQDILNSIFQKTTSIDQE